MLQRATQDTSQVGNMSMASLAHAQDLDFICSVSVWWQCECKGLNHYIVCSVPIGIGMKKDKEVCHKYVNIYTQGS